jgi:purine-cytosine permease-like protein
VVLAVWGYRLIHAVQPYLVVIMTGVWFAMLGLILASGDHLAKGMGGTHLASFPIFLVVVGLFFMNQLSWAIYVSDYSRYMPKNTNGPKIFTAVAVGSTASTVAFCALGAWVTAISPTASSPVTVIASVAGKWVLWFSALSLIAGAAMNAYTGMLSWEAVRSTWQQVSLSRIARVIGVLLISVISLVLALVGWQSFVTTFSNFLSVLLFVFVPWSLINLVDFYWVQRERYDVASFYTPRGIYGGWRWVAVARRRWVSTPVVDARIFATRLAGGSTSVRPFSQLRPASASASSGPHTLHDCAWAWNRSSCVPLSTPSRASESIRSNS